MHLYAEKFIDVINEEIKYWNSVLPPKPVPPEKHILTIDQFIERYERKKVLRDRRKEDKPKG